MKQGNLFCSQNKYPSSSSMREQVNTTLTNLIRYLDDPALKRTDVIRWGSPVPSFGDISRSKIATLGINPSNREFVDDYGNELRGTYRRFHSLESLGLSCWADVEDKHLDMITDSCQEYFWRNPYDKWFRKLDVVISGTMSSFYNSSPTACHLDLVPYATLCKWNELSKSQHLSLLSIAGDTLGQLLRNSPVRLLILNGKSVVNMFQNVTDVNLEETTMKDWMLPRRKQSGVVGIAYKGVVNKVLGVELQQSIVVLGFNHNLQSSFGVSKKVIASIQHWISHIADEVNL